MISEKGKESLVQFGDYIRNLRVSKGLSYRQMSLLCNVDYANIRRIEQGKVNVTLLTLEELAKALELEPGELLKYRRDPAAQS